VFDHHLAHVLCAALANFATNAIMNGAAGLQTNVTLAVGDCSILLLLAAYLHVTTLSQIAPCLQYAPPLLLLVDQQRPLRSAMLQVNAIAAIVFVPSGVLRVQSGSKVLMLASLLDN
jgi:hypothetical protein